MIDKLRQALSSETISRRFRELLAKDMKNPKHVAKMRRSYEQAAQDGKVSNWREFYPDPD